MLRGPQTTGELRGRTERMHDFADLDEVTRVLESLASRQPEPLVREGLRGRWMHLFGDQADGESEAEPPPSRTRLEDRVDALRKESEELERKRRDAQAELGHQIDALSADVSLRR